MLSLLLTLPGQAATVLSIGAGDTLGGEDRGKRLTIRLACIDAAEMAQNPYGAQSRTLLASQCNAADYLGAERGAEVAQQGVWSVPGGIQRPWGFRHGRRYRCTGFPTASRSRLTSSFGPQRSPTPLATTTSDHPPRTRLMRLSSLAQRHRQPEWMDQPGIDPVAHSQALQGLRRINAFSGAVGSLFAPIRSLARENATQQLRVLDLACGGGDNTTALAERARREGLAVQVDGCDLSPQAVAIATQHADERALGARFFQADALNDPLPEDYDVILCSLFLHHLDEEQAVNLLQRMGRASRCLVLVNDLIRSPLGYGLAWAGCRLLSRSPIVHFDGPVSVQGAFQLSEVRDLAARAGLEGAALRRSWPERYLLSWRRSPQPQ